MSVFLGVFHKNTMKMHVFLRVFHKFTCKNGSPASRANHFVCNSADKRIAGDCTCQGEGQAQASGAFGFGALALKPDAK